jgi:hypothetical protein
MFLGAHMWGQGRVRRRHNPHNCDNCATIRKCCCSSLPRVSNRDASSVREKSYLQKVIAKLSLKDKVDLITQIIRDAPEFGVCWDLASALYAYFVFDAAGIEREYVRLNNTLVEEIEASPMEDILGNAFINATHWRLDNP